jgi:hypothetical protein
LAIKPLLIDTGPFVAYLDRADSEHDRIAPFLGAFTGTLCTTAAVVTESMHLLKDNPGGPRRLAEFVQAVHIEVFAWSQPQELLSAVTLMEKYLDAPMDFADATLVLLADRIGVNQIVTLDRRGFGIYRTGRGRPFEILPRI